MRLDRLLVNLGFGSRKEVQQLIKDENVEVNNKIITSSNIKLNPNIDKVIVLGEEIYYKDEIILAINKPIGYLSANTDNYHPVVMELLKPPYHRHQFLIAGRLDLDAQGLLILSTSGDTVHEITNPNKEIPKTYIVTLDTTIDSNLLNRLLEPIPLKDGKGNTYLAKAESITKISDNVAEIVITSGKFHQVKRMFQALGYEVVNLNRVKIGKYRMPNLELGEYIEITKDMIL